MKGNGTMKPLQGDSVHNNSCSCTSCDSKSESDRQTFKRLLVQGSRINRLLTSKYHMHLRQSHLLDKLIKTRALYDALISQLLSSSECSASDVRPRQSSIEIRKACLEAKKSSDISTLVDLVDKGVATGMRKLRECCSCCRCNPKLKLNEHVQKSRRNRPVHAGGNIPSRCSVSKQETGEAKNIKSDPCTCACYEHEKNKKSKEIIDKTRPRQQITERDSLSTASNDHTFVSLNHGMLRKSHHKFKRGKAYPPPYMEYIGEGSNKTRRKSKLTHENVIKKTESKEMLKVAQKYIKDSLKASCIISQKKEPESRSMVGKTAEESMIHDNKTATKFIEHVGCKRKVQISELKQRLAHRTRKITQGRKENTSKSDTSSSSNTSILKETSFIPGDKRQKRVRTQYPKEYTLEEPHQQKKTKESKILPQKDPADEVNKLPFNLTPRKNCTLKRCLCSLKLKMNDTKSRISKNVTNENLIIKDKQPILLKNLLPSLKTYDCDYNLIKITQSKVKVLCNFSDETKRPPEKKSHTRNSATSTRTKHDLRRCFCTLQLGKQEKKKYNKRNEMKVAIIQPNIKVQSSQNKFKLTKHDVPYEYDSYLQQEEGRMWKKKFKRNIRKSRSNISILTSRSVLLSGIKDINSILISHRSETHISMLDKIQSSDISSHRVSERSPCLCLPMDKDHNMKRNTRIHSSEDKMNPDLRRSSKSIKSKYTNQLRSYKTKHLQPFKLEKNNPLGIVPKKAKMKSKSSDTRTLRSTSNILYVKSDFQQRNNSLLTLKNMRQYPELSHLPQRARKMDKLLKRRVNVGSNFSFNIEFYKNISHENNLYQNRPNINDHFSINKQEGNFQTKRYSSNETTQLGANRVSPVANKCFCTLQMSKMDKHRRSSKSLATKELTQVYAVNTVAIAENKMKAPEILEVDHDLHCIDSWCPINCSRNTSSHTKQWQYFKENPTCGISISMIAFKAKHKLQIRSKDQSLLHFASNELVRFESAFICDIDNIDNQTERQIFKIAQSNDTLAHRRCTVENSETENEQNIRNPDQVTGVQPLLRRCYCTMNIQVSRQKRKLLDYEYEPGICIPGECDPYECQKLTMKRLMRKVSRISGAKSRSRSSSSVKKLQPDRRLGPRRMPRSRHPRPQGLKYQTLPRAYATPANRQAFQASSKFSYDIKFSKGSSKSAPTTDFVRVPKRQTPGTKYRRHNNETQSMMRPMRHRASSVTPMLKRCFCTLKLQKKGRQEKELESQVIEQVSLGTSTPPEFRDEISFLRTTERGQNTSRKRRLLPYECEPGICMPGECDPYECLELIKRRNKHRKDFGTDSMVSSISSASSTSSQKRKRKRIQARRFRAKHVKSRTTSVRSKPSVMTIDTIKKQGQHRPVRQSIPSRQAVKICSNFSFNIEFYKDQTCHDTDTRPSEVYEQRASKPVRKVHRGVYANRRMRRDTYSQDGTSTRDDDSQIGIYHRGQSTMTTGYPQRQLSVDASTQGKPYRFAKLKRCFCTLKLMSPYQRRLIKDGNVGHERSSVLYRRIGGTQTRRAEPDYEVSGQTQTRRDEPDYEVSDQTQTRELRKRLLRNQKTGMRRPRTRSTSSYFSSSNPSRSRMTQTRYARPRRKRRQLDYAPRESVIEEKVVSYDSPQRQAVRISSNFSFNIEFSKDCSANLNVQTAAPIVKKYRPSYRRTRDRGLRGRRLPTFYRDSQMKPTPRRDIGLGPILRRCFCTLKLKKKNKSKGDMKEETEAETRSKSKAKTKAETRSKSKAETRSKSKAKTKADNKAEETEPQYQKTTNKRHKCICDKQKHKCLCDKKKHKCLCDKQKSNICTCPPPVKEVTPPSVKEVTPPPVKEVTPPKTPSKKLIGSKVTGFRPARRQRAFTHKLEPYECEPGICVPGECDPYKCLKRMKRRLKNSSRTSTDRRETKTKKKGVSNAVSKVLSKVGSKAGSKTGSKAGSIAGSKAVSKVGSKAGSKVDNKAEETQPQYQKTTNKRHKCLCDKKKHKCLCDKQKSNICTCPPPVKEVTPPPVKEVTPPVKEVTPPKTPSKKSIGSKVAGFRPAKRQRAFTHKLEPYECEPGICVPGECDPYKCLKRMKRRLMNSSGTSTDRRETRSTANMARYGRDSNSQSDMQRKKPMRTRDTFTRYKERKPYSEKRQNRERRTYREVRPQTRSVEYRSTDKSNKHPVKIGSNVNIGIQFAIDQSGGGSGATSRPLKQHTVRHVKITRIRSTERQSTYFRNNRVQNSRDNRDKDFQASGPSMSSIKTGSVAPFLKRCFCTLQLHCNTENQGSPFEYFSDFSETKIQKLPQEKVPTAEKSRHTRKQSQFVHLRCNTENQRSPFKCISHISKTEIPKSITREKVLNAEKNTHTRKLTQFVQFCCNTVNHGNPFECFTDISKTEKQKTLTNENASSIEKSKYTKKQFLGRKLKPYECELGVCVPGGECDPYECLKLINKRKPTKQAGTVPSKSRSISSSTPERKKSRTKKIQTRSYSPHRKNFKIPRRDVSAPISSSSDEKRKFKPKTKTRSYCPSQRNRHDDQNQGTIPTQAVYDTKLNREAVRLGSNFNIKLEFFKDVPPQIPSVREVSNIVKEDKRSKVKKSSLKKLIHIKPKPMTKDTVTRSNSTKKTDAKCSRSGTPLLKRCFCTLKFEKKGKQRLMRTKKTDTKCPCPATPSLKRCFFTLKFEKKGKQTLYNTKTMLKSLSGKRSSIKEELLNVTSKKSSFKCKSKKSADSSFKSVSTHSIGTKTKNCRCRLLAKICKCDIISVKQEKYPCKRGKKCKCAPCKCNTLALEISQFPCRKKCKKCMQNSQQPFNEGNNSRLTAPMNQKPIKCQCEGPKANNCKCYPKANNCKCYPKANNCKCYPKAKDGLLAKICKCDTSPKAKKQKKSVSKTCECNMLPEPSLKASVKMSDKKTSTKRKFNPSEITGIRIKRAPRRSVYTHKRIKSEGKQYSPDKVENIVEEPRYSFLLGRDTRQGVKITSNFSFNIDFYKEMLPPVMDSARPITTPKLQKATHPQVITVGRVEEIRPLSFYKQYYKTNLQEIETMMSYAPGKYDKNNRHKECCSCRKCDFCSVDPIQQGAQDINEHPEANQSTLKKIYCYCKNLFKNRFNKQNTKDSESRTEFNKTTNKRPLIDNLKSSNSERHPNKANTAGIKQSKSLKAARVSGKNDYKKKYSRFQSGDHKSTKLQNTGIKFKQNCQIKVKQTIHENIRFTTLRTDKILKFKPAIVTDQKKDSKPVSFLFKSPKLKKSNDVEYFKLCSCCGGIKRTRNLSSASISLDKENNKDAIPTVILKDVVIPSKIEKIEEETALHRKNEQACPCCACKSVSNPKTKQGEKRDLGECGGITCKKVAHRCAEYIKYKRRESETAICSVESEKEALASESGYCRDSNRIKYENKLEQGAVIHHTEIIDKEQDKLKKLPKHNSTSDPLLVAESAYDISELELTSVDSLGYLHSVVSGPKDIWQTCKSYQCDPKCAWKKCLKAVSNGPGRLKLKCLARKCVKEDKEKLKDHPVTNLTLHSEKQALWRRPGSGVGWSQFMLALREKPWLNAYCKLAGLHPRCLTVLQVWKQFADVILFFLAVAVWSPCLLGIGLCRALKCCFSCT